MPPSMKTADNAQALGLDMGTEPQSRAAIQKAIDTGEPTVSAAIALVQDVQQTSLQKYYVREILLIFL